MPKTTPFAEVLEAADHLTAEEQEALLELLHKRMTERRRAELAADVQASGKEFREGRCRPSNPGEICREMRT